MIDNVGLNRNDWPATVPTRQASASAFLGVHGSLGRRNAAHQVGQRTGMIGRMRQAKTLTEFAIRHGVHRAHVARILGIPQEELDLLDHGHAEVAESDVPTLKKRLGRSCDEIDLRRLLDELQKAPCPYDWVQRLGRCSDEWKARRGEGLDPERFLDEQFPGPLDRRQVVGPNAAGNFEWRRVVVRIVP